MERKGKVEGVRRLWDRYKYVGLVTLIGAALLLWPSGSGSTASPSKNSGSAESAGEAQELAQELEEILGRMEGVGQVQVLLTVQDDGQRQLAADGELSYSGSPQAPEDYRRTSETVLVDGAQGDEPVVTQRTSPTYRGALVVCQGGGQASVRLAVTEAVTVLTGLPADRVTVAKWQ